MASEIRTVLDLAEAFEARASSCSAEAESARAKWGSGFARHEFAADAWAEAARMARDLAKGVGDGKA